MLVISAVGFSQSFTDNTSGTGTFTVPAGVTSITVETWGGGGRGASISSNGDNEGGGGGGGAYASSTITVTPGATYNYFVGAGSTGTGAGGDTWFVNTSTVMAKGGSSSNTNSNTGANGGSAPASVGTTKFSGGNGADGSWYYSYGGGGGSSAAPGNIGSDGFYYIGGVAAAGGGNGGDGRNGGSGNGTAGSFPGGGGGGSRTNSNTNRTGGSGGTGQLILTWSSIPEINLEGNSVTIVDGDVTPSLADFTDFGNVDVTSATLSRTFTIRNTGTGTLTIGAITLAGPNPGDFTISSAPAASVAGGGSTTFTIVFNPSAIGLRSTHLSMVNSDSDENPYNFYLQGTGIQANPEINIRGNNANIASGDTTPSVTDFTDFGQMYTATGSVTRTFRIQNLPTGTTALNIGAITFSGAGAADFSITTPPAAVIGLNLFSDFTITFNPSTTGLRPATITIVNNDQDENPYTFALIGEGIAPEIDVTGNTFSITDGDTTPIANDGTDFGSVNITNGTSINTFVISNASFASMPLTLGAITITGADAADFTITTAPATSLISGATTNLVITFNPTTTGVKNAVLTIVNDDPNENPYNFNIRGTGSNPEIDVVGNLLSIADGDNTPWVSDQTDFGSASIDGGYTTVNYTIRNLASGVGILNIGAITITGAGASSYSIVVAPASVVNNNGSTTLSITFQPTTIGIKNAIINIANDDANENPYNFSITGLGVRTYADTDGDNIADNIDIDDDNDGILDVNEQTICASTAPSIEYTFLNETFGAGLTRGLININIPGATSTYCYEDGIVGPNNGACDYQYLASLNDGEYVVISSIADHGWSAPQDHTPSDVSGRMAVFNADEEPGIFYDTDITGIIPNLPITYSFWVLNIMPAGGYIGSSLPNITVEFLDMSGNILSTYNTGNIGRCGTAASPITLNTCIVSEWRQYSTSVNLGNVTAFTIRFRNNAPGGGGNDLALDDITIKQNYCDWEGDGIANIFDLDSDNDGIPDIEEAGFKALSNGFGTMDLTLGVWIDANGNGLHDTIDAMIAGGSYAIPDTDVDALKNFIDLDSDNDSLFDVDEAGLLNGDGDIDGDGFGDGADTDRDGILNLFDTYVGFGTLARPFAQDTDGNGIPDYMSLDSDGNGIFDIAESLYSSLDANNNGKIDGIADIDKDGIIDTFDTDTSKFGSPRNLERKLFIEFDGRNDYATGTQLLSGLAQATLMGWVKIPASYNADGVLFGQENFSIRLTPGKNVRILANSVNLQWSTPLQPDIWYHVAAVYNGADPASKLRLYVNGLQVNSTSSGVAQLNASTTNFTIGKLATSNQFFFKGWLDEIRAFNTALTADQIQKMVYQEIKQNGASIRGEFIPKDIESTTWNSLLAYHRLDNYKGDVIDNHITPAIDAGTNPSLTRIYNVKNIKYQLAPMPFITTQSSALDLAVSQNNFVNGNDVFTYPWSIVHMKHNMTLSSNLENLGLVINPSINVILDNNNQLRNNWYLKLDGRIDLKAKSQLVQTLFSDLDPTSFGYIERDQQGTVNPFNYNYWSSPVGAMSSSTNNNNYSVNGVMKDGTDPENITNINWTTGYTAPGTNPITLSSYWIYKFQNLSNTYANWVALGQSDTILPAQGFTLKGSGVLSESQNYTFIGKPFNGAITNPIAADNLNLTGNPYASALDAQVFLQDNLVATSGTIYFWEHYATNDTHVLADYQGGYAARNLVGGTPPVAPAEVSGLGSSSRTPGRFIPVGQGFFMTGSALGGTINFNNGQRAFIKEDNVLSNVMFKASAPTIAETPMQVNNAEDVYDDEEEFGKVRLGFNSVNNYHRQILLGFMNEYATAGIDPGYDAIHFDNQPSDMSFINGDILLNIQGDGYFNENNIYPLQVKTATTGTIEIVLDGTESFDAQQSIYIFDSLTNIYHNIREGKFMINLAAGTYDDRFSLRFVESSLSTNSPETNQNLIVVFSQSEEMLNIRNNKLDVVAQTVTLFNMLGQQLTVVDVANLDQSNIMIPIKNYSTGTYIVKITTNAGDQTEKIIIK